MAASFSIFCRRRRYSRSARLWAGLPALPWEFGLSAVIEEEGGAKSLWALRHGEGKADFHADACFAARLAAPQGA